LELQPEDKNLTKGELKGCDNASSLGNMSDESHEGRIESYPVLFEAFRPSLMNLTKGELKEEAIGDFKL